LTVQAIPEAPPAELRYRFGFRIDRWITELWRSRELIWTLTERELRARYKQASLGYAWALITPVMFMVVFSLFFKRVAKVDTGGSPYELFSYLGLLPWTFFSSSMSNGASSLVTSKMLLNRIYCPREVFPISSVVVAAVDTTIAVLALGLLFVIKGTAPHIESLWLPVILAVQVGFTVGLTVFASGVMIYLRDVRYGLPLVLQLGLFATPVAYGIEVIPRGLRTAYAAANPLAGVITSYRNTILHGQPPAWELLVPGAITSSVLLLFGYVAFKRMEVGFADIA
jgi:ABC-2 type transport system permease protein/lipopolysaccharide transport system permease protein